MKLNRTKPAPFARHPRHALSWLLILLTIAAFSACDSGGNVPVNEVFTGQLGFGEQNDHLYSLTEQTTIRFEVVSVVRDPVNILSSNTVSVAIGNQTVQGCSTGFSFGGTDGSIELIAIQPGDQCITVFEPGFLGQDQTITYTVRLTNL